MPPEKPPKTSSLTLWVPLTQAEHDRFEELRKVLDVPKTRYARILLRYAMDHPKEAVAEAYDRPPMEEPAEG